MFPNHSPWIKQLNRTRPVTPLDEDLVADVVIVGGGIAGIMTAYFTLRDTDRAVLILEGDKVAHGATGHNAGQLVSYFERSFQSLVEEFGITMASDGVRMVENAWTLLDTVVQEAGLTTPIHRFTGYSGICMLPQLLEHLEENRLRLVGGLQAEHIVIAREFEERLNIPKQYRELYELAPHEDILNLLETNTLDYLCAISAKKGVANSALIAEELTGYLLTTYPTRFRLHEGTRVSDIQLAQNTATLTAQGHSITATSVVLATNGFENFTIQNSDGADIDTEFHHHVRGLVGYMTGYLEQDTQAPIAISYYPTADVRSDDDMGDDYFYLTRRPYEHEGSNAWNLVCVGGPDKELPELRQYVRGEACETGPQDDIRQFLSKEYRRYPGKRTEHQFCWHGLMGYTPNLVRRVGVEPLNHVLHYNLGCNGVGLLPSIMGGERLARLLRGETLPLSIFDPLDQRLGSV